jgi:hypothetical protein
VPANKKHRKKRTRQKPLWQRFRIPRQLVLILFVLVFGIIGTWLLYSSQAASPEHIITTLYAYPTESPWQQVEQSAPTVKYAIIDVCAPDGSGSGCNGKPATAKNPDWPSTISALENAGITPLYYISTNYGATSVSTLESEVQQAISWYGVASVHWDTMQPSGTCSNGGSSIPCTTYNADLYNFAVSKGAVAVMFNPGTTYGVSTADIFGSKEILEVFEGTAASFEKASFPSWMNSYSSNQFVATLSAGTSSTVGTDVADAVKDNIGNIYEDDESEPPNYSTLPAFWSTEVKDVAANSGTPTKARQTQAPSATQSPVQAAVPSNAVQHATTPTAPSVAAQNTGESSTPKVLPVAGGQQSSAADVSPTVATTTTPAQATAESVKEAHSLNPFIRVRHVLFANYKGSKVISNIGTIIVFLLPVLIIAYVMHGGLIERIFKNKN